MDRLRCGPLAAWASAWLAGIAAFDDVLVAADVNAAAPTLALAVPGGASVAPRPDRRPSADGRVAPLGEILIAWRQAKAPVRLALPVPGDVRGLPGPAAFRTAALDAGQAVVGAGVGVVPVVIDHRPSSAPPTLLWQRFDIEASMPDYVSVGDAQYELTEAIRECASVLATLAGPGDREAERRGELNDELIAARRAGERINLPPGFPAPAVALVAQAERMAAVLALAGVDQRTEPDHRADALAPLVLAVRRARLAGYNAAA